ncbi:MAG TPA: hypothetical protein H9825_09115 [Candidatus Sphingobacterium stercorigallinarum]|nr:hypothetical protein [Candidatus Sphingobacterium stercorigallinarum]
MALGFQTLENSAPEGAEVIHGDAMVSDGTLLALDFSNKGCLYGYSLKNGYPVRDLAKFANDPLGIDNSSRLIHNGEGDLTLTPGLGLPMHLWGLNPGGAYVWGMNLGKDLLEYMSANNDHEFIFTFWVRRNMSIPVESGAFVTSTQSVDGNNVNAVRINTSANGNMTPSFAGVAAETGIVFDDDSLYQVSIHYKGAGETLGIYINGVYSRESNGNALGFGSEFSDLVIGKTATSNPCSILYRILIDDLTASGRTAIEFASKDYQLCTGTGQYNYIEERPFISVD